MVAAILRPDCRPARAGSLSGSRAVKCRHVLSADQGSSRRHPRHRGRPRDAYPPTPGRVTGAAAIADPRSAVRRASTSRGCGTSGSTLSVTSSRQSCPWRPHGSGMPGRSTCSCASRSTAWQPGTPRPSPSRAASALWLIDFKTSATKPASTIYDEHALQLAALRWADEMWLPDGTVAPMVRGIVGTACSTCAPALRLHPVFTGTPKRALHALVAAKWRHSNPSPAPSRSALTARPRSPLGARAPGRRHSRAYLPPRPTASTRRAGPYPLGPEGRHVQRQDSSRQARPLPVHLTQRDLIEAVASLYGGRLARGDNSGKPEFEVITAATSSGDRRQGWALTSGWNSGRPVAASTAATVSTTILTDLPCDLTERIAGRACDGQSARRGQAHDAAVVMLRDVESMGVWRMEDPRLECRCGRSRPWRAGDVRRRPRARQICTWLSDARSGRADVPLCRPGARPGDQQAAPGRIVGQRWTGPVLSARAARPWASRIAAAPTVFTSRSQPMRRPSRKSGRSGSRPGRRRMVPSLDEALKSNCRVGQQRAAQIAPPTALRRTCPATRDDEVDDFMLSARPGNKQRRARQRSGLDRRQTGENGWTTSQLLRRLRRLPWRPRRG